MCGIAGLLLPDRDPGRIPEAARSVAQMNHLQQHRGPDDAGLHEGVGIALGHRRLSILDLTPRGHQPMQLAGTPLWIVHNGEVYNYRELRAELEGLGRAFVSETDTEVILASYARWGPACLERFNGMFAFAIWDEREEVLFCARDRLGIKPFHHAQLRDGTFAFASEIKAFHALPQFEFEADDAAVAVYVGHGRANISASDTFVRGVRALAPGHFLRVRRGESVESQSYWDLRARLRKAARPDEDRAVAGFREQLEDSVRLRLRSDVPVGTCLSGGLDSSTLVVLVDALIGAGAQRTRQATFSACFDEPQLDERPFMRAVSAATRTEPHQVFPTAQALDSEIDDLIWHQDEPFGSTSIFAQRCVFRAAREAGVPVTLDGQGADELLGGYLNYPPVYLLDLEQRGERRAKWREAWLFARAQGAPLRRVLRRLRRARRKLAAPQPPSAYLHPRLRAGAAIPGPLAGAAASGRGPLIEHLIVDLSSQMLPALLRYADRNSMTYSVESRVPFLDHRIVEFVFGLPPRALHRDGWTKRLLRDAFADLLPDAVTWRRDKIGFASPEASWFRGPLGERLESLLAEPGAPVFERYVDRATLAREWRHFRGGGKYRTDFWRALNLHLWLEGYLQPPAERLATPA